MNSTKLAPVGTVPAITGVSGGTGKTWKQDAADAVARRKQLNKAA
jgi:hypothetical protein